LFAVAFAPLRTSASLTDVVKRKRTRKAAELYTIDVDVQQNLGAATGKDDATLNEFWNKAIEFEFIDERLLQSSESMRFPMKIDMPPPGDESPDEKPSPTPPSEDRPTPSEPTTPPKPSEPTTPPEPATPGACLEGTTRQDYIRDLLSSITDPTLLDDPGTPQGQAFEFLVSDDFDPCTYPTIEQRYGLSVLYYSTLGEDWKENEGWVQIGVSECQWFNITCGETETDLVVAVHLGKSILVHCLGPP
jgi:hypothetical protein